MSFLQQASVLTRWGHDTPNDARAEMWDALGDYQAVVEVWGTQFVLADYMRPDLTKGGIKTTDKSQAEDVFQGSVGMIIAIGPAAFADLDVARFGGRLPEIGDFVYCRPQDTVMCHVRGPGWKMRKRQIPIMETEYDRDGREIGAKPSGRFREEQFREFEGWPCRWVYMRDIYGRVKIPHAIV